MQINALQSNRSSDVQPERLATDSRLSEQQKIREASRQFEAILLRQILDGATKPVVKTKFTDNSTTASIYHDMVTTQMADSISKSGALGLAQTFEQQLNRPAADSQAGSGETPVAQSSAQRRVPTGHHFAPSANRFPSVKPSYVSHVHE